MIDFTIPDPGIGLYLHVPFCKSICPYCPYNKVLYNPAKASQYKIALLAELAMYKSRIGEKTITSIYIGGGTPTVFVQELAEILTYVRNNFRLPAGKTDIGIEIHPNEVTDALLCELKKIGINLISLGVQTFTADKLKFLGRNYTEADIDYAINLIKKHDFDCLDIDIMTNIPGQTFEDIAYDLRKVYSYQIDQLSIYPLIVFPMTPLYKVIKEKKLPRFNELQEGKILKIIDQISADSGYERSSVWTYGKKQGKRYTSVTRESFIGVGASATSLFGNYFYLNTFNVDAYIERVSEGKMPINLVNAMSERERMLFWLFWRCYDGIISETRFKEVFTKEIKQEFPLLLGLLQTSGMVKREGQRYILTEWGSYAYHLVEKRYSIHYLNNMWEACMAEPWLEEFYL